MLLPSSRAEKNLETIGLVSSGSVNNKGVLEELDESPRKGPGEKVKQ